MVQPAFLTTKISSDLHELQNWSWAVRGEQLLHTSYATECRHIS